MIKTLASSFVKDFVLHLKENKGEATQHPLFGSLKGMSGSELLDDLKNTVEYLKGSLPASESKIMKAMGNYFTDSFPAVFDQLNTDFFALSSEAQPTRLKELLPGNEHFFHILRSELLVQSPQEIEQEILQFLRNVFEAPLIVAQSPVECQLEVKKQIRDHFKAQHAHAFVVFQVNPQLIGGIRFFVNGKVQDHSWFGRIATIRQLHHLVG